MESLTEKQSEQVAGACGYERSPVRQRYDGHSHGDDRDDRGRRRHRDDDVGGGRGAGGRDGDGVTLPGFGFDF